MNEQERKLRHVWATEPDIAKKLIVPGDDIHRALRAFCESEPVEGGDVELLRVTLDSTRRQLDQTTELLKAQGITLAAVEKERAKMGDENIAIKCDRDWLKGQLDLLRAKLAAAEKERDEAMSKLNRTTTRLYAQIDSIEAKHAEAMRALATRNANELNAAQRALSAAKHERDDARLHLSGAQSVMESQREVLDAARRSFKAQLADLQRALESEKKAHGEALGKLAEAWKRGEPSAPAMLEVCAAAQAWHAVDRELDPLNAARATGRLIRAVRALEEARRG